MSSLKFLRMPSHHMQMIKIAIIMSFQAHKHPIVAIFSYIVRNILHIQLIFNLLPGINEAAKK